MRPLLIYFFCYCFLAFTNAQSNLEFTAGCEDISDCGDDVCFYQSPTFVAEATTDCNQGSFLVYNYSVDIDNDGFVDFSGSGNQVSFSGEVGIHKITFEVSDQCGSVISCEKLITVEDCTPPVLQCLNFNFFPFLPDDTLLTIFADSLTFFNLSDNCDEVEDLILSFSDSTYVPSITFSCSEYFQLASYEVPLFVTDGSGNQATCILDIVIDDDEFGACNVLFFDTIPVCVSYSDLVPMDDYQVNNIELIDDSDSDCKFYIPNTGFTIVEPTRNTNPNNGLTILDLILMRKHILQIQPLSDPFKLMAADVNNSGSISGFDIVLLSKTLLKDEPGLQASWLFVDADYDVSTIGFGNAYPNYFSAYEIDSTDFPLEFIGVKAGDLDCSVDISEQTNGFLKPQVGTITFCAEDKMLEAGSSVLIPITAKDYNDIAGFIFTINVDSSKLSLFEVFVGDIFLQLGPSINNASNKLFPAFFVDSFTFGSTFSDEDTLFTFRFDVFEDVLLSDAFSLDGSSVEMDAYNSDEERVEVKFDFCNPVNNEELERSTFHLMENFPNPFNDVTSIPFELTENQDVTLTVFDISGRQVKSIVQNFPAGLHSLLIKKIDLPSDGIYYFEVKTTENIGVGKMILN